MKADLLPRRPGQRRSTSSTSRTSSEAEAEKHRHTMIEAVAEMDDELTHKYLEGEELTIAEIKRGLRLGTLTTQDHPGPDRLGAPQQGRPEDARRGRRLPAVAARRPADDRARPEDRRRGHPDARTTRSRSARSPSRSPPTRSSASSRSSGSTPARSRPARTCYNPTKGKKERIGRILQMHANHREEIDEVYAGDIAAAVGLKDTFTGDTLTDPDHPVILESMTFPEPVIEVKIEPKTKADQDKLAIALQRLAEEDPTFRVHTDPESSETLIAGMGELHLDVLVDRMIREFKVAANIGKPQVSYRETIRRAAEGNGRFVRQTGGKGQYGHADHQARARTRRARATSSSTRSSAARSRASTSSRSTQGIREALADGHLRRVTRWSTSRSTLFDGSYHEVDSSEMAFKIAGSMAVKDAFAKADPAILEPIMRVEVTMPEEFMGDVIGDLNSRRGQIEGMESRGSTAGRPGVRPARPDVRLRHGPAVDDPGPRDVVDGVQSLRRGPGQPGLGARPEVEGLGAGGAGARSSHDGQEEVRAHQAARQHRHDRPHRPRQDEPDRGDHQVPRPEGRGRVPRLRLDRQRARGARARDHDRDRPRRVRDRRPPLRPRRLPGPRRLHQEHDHRRRPDGRRDPRRRRDRRADAPDPRAHPPRPPGRGPVHRRLPQQGRHGRRPRAPRPRRARGPRAPDQVRLPGRRPAGHPGQRPQGARGRRRPDRPGLRPDPGADGRGRRLHPDPRAGDRQAVPDAGRGRLRDQGPGDGRDRPHRARHRQGRRRGRAGRGQGDPQDRHHRRRDVQEAARRGPGRRQRRLPASGASSARRSSAARSWPSRARSSPTRSSPPRSTS